MLFPGKNWLVLYTARTFYKEKYSPQEEGQESEKRATLHSKTAVSLVTLTPDSLGFPQGSQPSASSHESAPGKPRVRSHAVPTLRKASGGAAARADTGFHRNRSGCRGFERELARSLYAGRFVVVIEASLPEVLRTCRGMSEASVIGTLAAWERRFCGFLFAGSIKTAADFSFRHLRGQTVDIQRSARAIESP